MEKKHIGMYNHRVLRTHDPFEMYKLVCVYYALDGTPTDHSEAASSTGDASQLYHATLEILEAFARPILDEDDIDFSRSTLEEEDEHGAGAYHTKLEG